MINFAWGINIPKEHQINLNPDSIKQRENFTKLTKIALDSLIEKKRMLDQIFNRPKRIQEMFVVNPKAPEKYVQSESTEQTLSLKEKISATVDQFDMSERIDILNYASRFYDNMKDDHGQGRVLIIEFVSKIPKEQWDDVFQHVAPLCEAELDGVILAYLIRTVSQIPQIKRNDMLAVLLKDTWDKKEGVKCINALSNIQSQALWENAVIDSAPFLEGIWDGEGRGLILIAVSEIDPKERPVVFELARPFFKNVKDGVGRSEILKAIYNFDANEREEIVKDAVPFLSSAKDYRKHLRVFEAVKEISDRKERANILTYALLVCKWVTKGKHYVISAISKIARNDRDVIITDAILETMGNVSSGKKWAVIISEQSNKY
jgi:hypothetical protein